MCNAERPMLSLKRLFHLLRRVRSTFGSANESILSPHSSCLTVYIFSSGKVLKGFDVRPCVWQSFRLQARVPLARHLYLTHVWPLLLIIVLRV